MYSFCSCIPLFWLEIQMFSCLNKGNKVNSCDQVKYFGTGGAQMTTFGVSPGVAVTSGLFPILESILAHFHSYGYRDISNAIFK